MQVLRRAFLPLSLLVLLTAVWIVPLPMFLEEPGALISLAERVEVDAPGSGPLAGDYLFATVHVTPATTATVVRAALDERVGLVPTGALIPPGLGQAEYFERQRTIFRISADVAAAVALRAAGYPVDAEDLQGDGAVVLEVLPGAPANGLLRPGDVITAVDGQPIGTASELRDAIARAGAGQPIELTFRRDGEELRGTVTPRPIRPPGNPAIGVFPDTAQPRIDLPVPVMVDVDGVGGPSAGLMIAVTVYDKVKGDVDLAAGRLVVGTGSLDERGRVGTIGGIRFKVLAAHRADADVFLAPAGQLDEALGGVPPGSDLQVVGVESFEDALQVLGEHAAQTAAPGQPGPGRTE